MPGDPKVLTAELLSLLERVTQLVSTSDRFDWATWDDAAEAVAELEALTDQVARGELPNTLPVLFLPTGDLQEVSFSGWADEYLTLSARFDALWSTLSAS